MKSTNALRIKLALSFFLLLGGVKLYTTYVKKPDLTVIGYMRMADGLGRQTVELINTFKNDLSINFISTQKNCFIDFPKKIKAIAKKPAYRLGKVVIFEDALWRPGYNAYEKLQTPKDKEQIRIAYSMFESSEIPGEWVSILNTYFDAVVVPDPFLIEIYQQCGVTLPIFVLPLGLDLQDFLNEPLKKKAGEPFVFANLSTCVDRKNQIALVHAFAKAFGSDNRFSLLINCRVSTDGTLCQMKQEILDLGLTNVYLSTLSLDNQSYLNVFRTIDCYVNLSKGEGFSIQPREAMALGIPVIVSDNTAQKTLCDSSLVKSIPTTAVEPANYPWGATYGHFFLCDTNAAASAMKEVYNNYPAYLNRSQEMRQWVEQYQYINLKPYYKSLVKPKKITLGEKNILTPEGITTNCKELYHKYKKL